MASVGPLAMTASSYHRKYLHELRTSSIIVAQEISMALIASSPIETVSSPIETVSSPIETVPATVTANFYQLHKPTFTMLFGIIIGLMIASAFWSTHTLICRGVIVPDDSDVIELSTLRTLKDVIIEGLKSMSAAKRILGKYWSDRYDEQQRRFSQLLKDTVQKVTNDGIAQLYELADFYHSQSQQDREELQRLRDEKARDKEEIKRLKAEQDQDKKEIQRLREQQDRSDRVRSEDIATKDQQIQDGEQKLEDAKTKNEADIENLKQGHNEALRKANAENTTKVNALTARHEARITSIRATHDNVIAQLQTAQKKAARDHEAESKKAKADHEKAMADLVTKKDAEIAKVKSEGEASRERAAKGHQDAIAQIRQGHQNTIAQMRQVHQDATATARQAHQDAITQLRQNHDSEMQTQESDLTSKHREALKEANADAYKKLESVCGELDDAEQEVLRLRRELKSEGNAHSSVEPSAEEKLPQDSASVENRLSSNDGASAENPLAPLDGCGDAESVVPEEESALGGSAQASGKKKRARKNRGVMARGKNPEGMSAEDRPLFIKQEAGNRSNNGRITFLDIDWAAVTKGLEGWNGYHIQCLIEEAKKIAREEAVAQETPRREYAVTQSDFERAIPNIDVLKRPTPIIPTAEEAAASPSEPLSWNHRQNLFLEYNRNHDLVKRGDDIDMDVIMDMTKRFNGTEVKRVINVIIERKKAEAAAAAGPQTREVTISQADMVSSILEHKAGLSKYENEDPQPAQPQSPHQQPHGNGNNTPPQGDNPRPPPAHGPVREGYGVYTPPHRQ